MRGLFFSETTAKTNEEYKKVVKSRMKAMLVIALIGAITVSAALFAKIYGKTNIKETMLGVYLGLGSGLLTASVVLWIKNLRILKNEEKLKESRLINSDERIQQISNKAFKVAAFVMIVFMYLVALIGGLFYPVLVQILLYLICLFLLVYMIAYRIYDRRM